MNVNELIKQYKSWECTGNNPLTKLEVRFLLENEEHEAFFMEWSLYQDLMNYEDHLLSEEE